MTLSTGKSVKLDQAAFGQLRALPNRAVRQKVMSAFFTALGSFSRTFGKLLSTVIEKQGAPAEGVLCLSFCQMPVAGFREMGWVCRPDPPGPPALRLDASFCKSVIAAFC